MASFVASADALQSLSRKQHWWLQVGSTAEDVELWNWMKQLWPLSAEEMTLIDACILLRPLMCNSVSCVDVTSLFYLHSQQSDDSTNGVTTQSLPIMLDEALEQQTDTFVGDADSATRAMAVHALMQLQPTMLPRLSSLTLPPRQLDYFEFLNELYAPDAINVLRLHEGKLSAAVAELTSAVDVPVFRWETTAAGRYSGESAKFGSVDYGEGKRGDFLVGSPLSRLHIRSDSIDARDDDVWDEADCVPDARMEWRNAVILFRAIGIIDLLPLPVVRAIAKEVMLHSQAHWLVLSLVERGVTRADAIKAVREAQTQVSSSGELRHRPMHTYNPRSPLTLPACPLL